MILRVSALRAFTTLLALAVTATTFAIDLVHRKSSEKTVGGEITRNDREGITVTQQVGMKEEVIPSADVAYIEWDAEPGPMKLARGSETTGALDEAIKQYQEAVKATASSKDGLKADARFGLARSMARRSIRTGENAPDAVSTLKDFVNSNRNNYRFDEAQMLLGELSLVRESFDEAELAYQSVINSPSPEYQLAGKAGLARALLGRGDVSKAKMLFDEVAGITPSSPAQESLRLEGMLGQALVLKQSQDQKGALKAIELVIAQAKPVDARVQAEAYLRQGELQLADGQNPKLAIIAYLHVDVIPEFAAERDLHAEALYHLARQWPVVGEAERGADAANRLKTQYPTSIWTRRLTGG